MLRAKRHYDDEELADREALWRMLLWDGASSHLVGTLARSDLSSLSALTPPVVAELAAGGAIASMEDAFELGRLAERDERRIALLREMVEARRVEGTGSPRITLVSEPGAVLVRVRPDLRKADYFGLDPHSAKALMARLKAAADKADELSAQRS